MRQALILVLGLVLGGTVGAKETAEAVVQRQVEAYNAHDLEAFVACYGEAIEFRTLDGGVNPSTGIGPLRKAYADIFKRHPNLKVKILNRISQGGFVIDQEQAEGMGPTPITVTAIYEVSGGKIIRVWFIEG